MKHPIQLCDVPPTNLLRGPDYAENGVDQCWKCENRNGMRYALIKHKVCAVPVCGDLAMFEVYNRPCRGFKASPD